METLLLVVALGVSALYLALVASNLVGIRRLRRGRSEKTPRVSVLVAARDEEAHLARCLEALLAQDYRTRGPLEIVCVDDRSRDGTGRILAEFAARHPGLVALRVDDCPPGVSPKMFALSRALERASGEILCVTDADCAPPESWVSELVAHFEDDVGFVAGPALRLPHGERAGWIAELAKIASIIGAAMGAGGTAWGMPWTCAGANLAYRREAFEAVGGYAALSHVASGDDDLLMQRIALRSDWRIGYALTPGSCVPSFERAEVRRFAQRQARHHARFREHPPRVQAMSVAVFGYYLWFLCGPLLAAGSSVLAYAWLSTTLARIAIEYPTLLRCAKGMGTTIRSATFLRTLPVFPAVVVLSALAGLRGRFTWKGQSFGRLRA